MPGAEISAFTRAQIITLHQEGLSRHQIAARLNIVRSTVSRTIQRFEETGDVASRPRSGRRRVTTEREDRYLAQYARRNRSIPIRALQFQFQRTYNRVISSRTVSRRLFNVGLHRRRPLRVPLLTYQQRQRRFQWAREHQAWLLPQWRYVVFTDETRIGLISDDYRQRVWREVGRHHRLNTALEVAPYQGGSEMFWGGIFYNGRTELIHVPQTMNAHFYLENVIRPVIYPLRQQIGHNFVLMDDNARPHRARIVQMALEEAEITRLDWPPLSPDMNPIEHVWDYLSRAINRRNNPPRNRQELILAAQEEWVNLPQETINNLIIGMHRRVGALISSRGGNTSY